MILDSTASKNIQRWLDEPYDAETKKTLQSLVDEKNPDLENAFYKRIEFGTGGMRGLMGIGTNRMNVYTIRQAVQGLANYLHRLKIQKPSVLIGYDARLNSRHFAEEAARVLVANQIKVFFFSQIRPTPLVSFGARHKASTAAIMVTASHNPPNYNGFKVYWSDGAQVLPPHDTGIIEEVEKIDHLFEIKRAEKLIPPLFEELLHDVDEAYLRAQDGKSFLPKENRQYGHELKLLYTSLHGTGITLMPTLLNRWGFSSLKLVDPQCVPDGHFTYAPLPNPEEKSALKMGSDKLISENLDLLIATDPDADRVGVVVRHKGKAVPLNGNEIASLCLWHIVKNKKADRSEKKPAFIKTVPTTELFRTIGEAHGYPVFDVLPGFKYIAELIRTWEEKKANYHFVFGGEESYGYLLGDSCRDKDALISSALISEIGLYAKRKNQTLIDLMEEIWREYGLYVDILHNISFPDTKESFDKMKLAMESLRASIPDKIAGHSLVEVIDYKSLTRNIRGKKESFMDHRSNLLLFKLEEGSKLIIRPSGTEPKMKIYCGVFNKNVADIAKERESLTNKASELVKALQSHLNL